MVTACLGLTVASQETVASERGERPNIVLIISDDQAWTDYGFMGHPHIRTPQLDKLAGESLVFRHGYVPVSLCCPSLVSMITGLYPWQHRITGNEPPAIEGLRGRALFENSEYRRSVTEMMGYIEQVPTLPKLLKTQGYRSLQTGKWWQGHYSRGGFTDGMTHGDPDRGGRHGDEGLKIGRQGLQEIAEFIEDCGETPYFIWYAPFLPHTPHNPPEDLLNYYLDKTDSLHIARYWAMCEWFDQTCGELLGLVENAGHKQDTIVVFVTDNGWIQNPDKGGYAPRSKRSPYEGGIRTPMMVHWPGRVPVGEINHPVSSIDIAPTLLDVCGIQRPSSMQGVSLLDLKGIGSRETIFGDVYLHNAVDIHEPSQNLTYRWVIEWPWKLIVPDVRNVTLRAKERHNGKQELYHLGSDPHENHNVIDQHTELSERLHGKLNQWWSP